MMIYVGIDHSLKRTGMAAIRDGWGGDPGGVSWGDVSTKRAAKSDRWNTDRMAAIVDGVVAFAAPFLAEGDVVVGIESHPFAGNIRARVALAELAGAIKVGVSRLGVMVHEVNVNHARSVLVGKYKRKWIKNQVMDFLGRAGVKPPNADCGDAFAVAYALFVETGGNGKVLDLQESLI